MELIPSSGIKEPLSVEISKLVRKTLPRRKFTTWLRFQKAVASDTMKVTPVFQKKLVLLNNRGE